MDELFHRKNIEEARLFEFTENTEGWQTVFIPKCKMLFNKADIKCHDHRLRDENGKYWLGVYDGIRMVLDLQTQIKKNKNIAMKELKRKGKEVSEL